MTTPTHPAPFHAAAYDGDHDPITDATILAALLADLNLPAEPPEDEGSADIGCWLVYVTEPLATAITEDGGIDLWSANGLGSIVIEMP